MSFKSISPAGQPFSVKFDTNSFKREIIQLISKESVQSLDAVDKAMGQFLQDCLFAIPKCPIETGDLMKHHEIVPAKRSGDGHRVEGTLRVKEPYAASLHEGITPRGKPYQFHTSDTGSHWVISKLLMYGNNYLKIIASGILTRSDSTAYTSILSNFLSNSGFFSGD